jgi:hypothetical protein
MSPDIDEVQQIINAYTRVVGGIDAEAHNPESERAYGGIIRAGKGKIHESITKQLISLAWRKLEQPESNLQIEHFTTYIPLNQGYIERIQNPEIKEYLQGRLPSLRYPMAIDWTVSIRKEDMSGFQPIVGIECKTYTENAMLKRVLVDCSLLSTIYPDMSFILVQLESQLGGDFSELNPITYGSPSTHTLFSYFGIDLDIITLLRGERKVDRPIHKAEFFKPLERGSLEIAINQISQVLDRYV